MKRPHRPASPRIRARRAARLLMEALAHPSRAMALTHRAAVVLAG